MKLRKISIIGLGLLGASVSLACSRGGGGIRTIGFAHRESTRKKAQDLGLVDEVTGSLEEAVRDADIVILATPISTFAEIFSAIKSHLKPGCIVTDVGSTKVMPCKWAKKIFATDIIYVGSHPIAGSEQRGLEFARDDLFAGANCIITVEENTDTKAVEVLKDFWSSLGCFVKIMSPVEHDRIFANVSHVPHITAVALMNATSSDDAIFAGKGFMDTTRIASGPESIWSDILRANSGNCVKGIDRLIDELIKIREAIKTDQENEIISLLADARERRAQLISKKMENKELL